MSQSLRGGIRTLSKGEYGRPDKDGRGTVRKTTNDPWDSIPFVSRIGSPYRLDYPLHLCIYTFKDSSYLPNPSLTDRTNTHAPLSIHFYPPPVTFKLSPLRKLNPEISLLILKWSSLSLSIKNPLFMSFSISVTFLVLRETLRKTISVATED